MEIGFISRELPPDTGWGGIGTYTLEMARALAARGHGVRVVSLASGDASTTTIDGVEIHRVTAFEIPFYVPGFWRVRRMHGWFVSAFSIAAARKIRELDRQRSFELVEAPEFNADAWALLLGPRRFPLVTRLHTPRELIDVVSGARLPKHRLSYLMERQCIRLADGITAPSRAIKAMTEANLSLSLPQLAAIPNPIDPEPFRLSSKPKEENSLLYVGRLEHRKGLVELSAAVPKILERLPALTITFLGSDGERKTGQTWGEYIRGLLPERLRGNLRFLKAPRSELPAIMARAEVAIFPSIWENFPYVLLECFASGTPAIASAFGGMAEIVDEGENGWLLRRRDVDEIVETTVAAFMNRKRLPSMGEAARAKVAAAYSSEVIASAMESYYSGLSRTWRLRGSV